MKKKLKIKKISLANLAGTTIGGRWVACNVNGYACRCQGDVEDCRAATGGGGGYAV